MNLNLLGYALYLGITIYIIVVVGGICYRNGNIFVSALIPDHEELCHRTNQILLLGYYLLNIGYCAITLTDWETIRTSSELVQAIAWKTGIIVCIISAMHYANLFIITNYIQKLIK
jgi:hypothetical protein